jgi:UDP-N-acetyl-D-mannosaminuronic acid dehydrogenase
MKVAVIGLGYVGVPVAAALADAGNKVVGIDILPGKVELLNKGKGPIGGKEPGLDDLIKLNVQKKRLRASMDYGECRTAKAVIVSVETPINDKTKDANYRPLKAALRSLGANLREKTLVSVESTLSPGTMEKIIKPILQHRSGLKVGRDFFLVHAPERVTAGKLLSNLRTVDRVIGANDPGSLKAAIKLYSTITRGKLHPTNWVTSEIVKAAENAYWDVQIGFANEIALVCEDLGANAYEVRELVNSCPFRNMLYPGAGVGGPCIPKDPWLLVSVTSQGKVSIIPAAREVNEFMPERLAQLAEEGLREAGRRIKGARIAVLGFSYREETEDTRNTPSVKVIRELRRKGAEVIIHDPYAPSQRGYHIIRDLNKAVRKADALVIVTGHRAYRKMDLAKIGRKMRRRVIVDGRNVFPQGLGGRRFVYRGLGRGDY